MLKKPLTVESLYRIKPQSNSKIAFLTPCNFLVFVFPKEITKINQKNKVKFFSKRGYEICHRGLFF